MSTTANPPAAPAAAPQPAASAPDATPAAPPIPAAQAASVPPPKPAPVSSRQPKDAPDAPPTIEADLKKLAADMLTPKSKAKAEPVPEKPAAPEAKPAAPAAPETKAEAKTDKAGSSEKEPLDIPEPKGMSPEALGNWKTWREQAKKEITEARAARDALNAQLETYKKATPADTEKAARLEARTKELEDKLAVYDLKSHPDFVKQYVEPKKNALKEAGEIVAYNGKEGVDLNAILELPQKDFNAKVSELTKDMNGMDATTVQSALRQAHKLTAEEKGALSKAGELKQQLAAKAAAEARQAFEETRNEIKAKVQLIPVPDGAPEERVREITEYNEAVTAAMSDAERYSFGRMSEKEVARMSHEAAMLKPVAQKLIPMLQRDLKSATELNQQLAAELAAIKKGKSAPAFTGSKEGSGAPDVSSMDFHQLAEHMLTRKSG